MSVRTTIKTLSQTIDNLRTKNKLLKQNIQRLKTKNNEKRDKITRLHKTIKDLRLIINLAETLETKSKPGSWVFLPKLPAEDNMWDDILIKSLGVVSILGILGLIWYFNIL